MTTARVLSHRLSCLCPQERPAEWGSGAWPSEKQQKAQLKFIYVHSRGEKQRPKLDPKTLRLKKKKLGTVGCTCSPDVSEMQKSKAWAQRQPV